MREKILNTICISGITKPNVGQKLAHNSNPDSIISQHPLPVSGACVKTILNIIALCRTPPSSSPARFGIRPDPSLLVLLELSDDQHPGCPKYLGRPKFRCEKFSCGDPTINCDWISHHFVTLLAMTVESVVTEGWKLF